MQIRTDHDSRFRTTGRASGQRLDRTRDHRRASAQDRGVAALVSSTSGARAERLDRFLGGIGDLAIRSRIQRLRLRRRAQVGARIAEASSHNVVGVDGGRTTLIGRARHCSPVPTIMRVLRANGPRPRWRVRITRGNETWHRPMVAPWRCLVGDQVYQHDGKDSRANMISGNGRQAVRRQPWRRRDGMLADGRVPHQLLVPKSSSRPTVALNTRPPPPRPHRGTSTASSRRISCAMPRATASRLGDDAHVIKQTRHDVNVSSAATMISARTPLAGRNVGVDLVGDDLSNGSLIGDPVTPAELCPGIVDRALVNRLHHPVDDHFRVSCTIGSLAGASMD